MSVSRRDVRESAELSLPEAFRQVAGQLRRSASQALAPHDVSPSHARALAVLQRHGAMRLRDLSAHLRIAPRSVTDVVDGLENRGFVQRSPDPQDRRGVVVELTAAGAKAGAAVRAAREADGERFFAALTDSEQRALARILRKLSD